MTWDVWTWSKQALQSLKVDRRHSAARWTCSRNSHCQTKCMEEKRHKSGERKKTNIWSWLKRGCCTAQLHPFVNRVWPLKLFQAQDFGWPIIPFSHGQAQKQFTSHCCYSGNGTVLFSTFLWARLFSEDFLGPPSITSLLQRLHIASIALSMPMQNRFAVFPSLH